MFLCRRNWGRLTIAALVSSVILGCGPSFVVTRVTAAEYPVTKEVRLTSNRPARPYIVLATFKGVESSICWARPYCSLYSQAETLGAQVIWVTAKEIQTRPEQWVEIQGRMTRIPASSYERLEGVFLRYSDD